MRHEGYLGAIGAFIKGAEEEAGTRAIVGMTKIIWIKIPRWMKHFCYPTTRSDLLHADI